VYRALASQTVLRGGLGPVAGQINRAGGDTSMTNKAECRPRASAISRRRVVTSLTVGVGAAAIISRAGLAQRAQVAPPSTITTPPRDFGPQGAPTTYFTDPDVLSVDPLFDQYAQPNSAIQRLWTGALWAEGPAWSAEGRYLVWSDIPNTRQLRWLEDNGRVSVFRMPSNNSNGNTFDFQGRQISCEHLTRRVVRYELNG
jgi:gluconolactonase